MLNALDNSWRIDEVSFPFTVELSVYSGFTVGCFGCPNLISVTRMGHACCTVMNMPPVLHSAAEAMMFLNARHIM